jgi:hypothetical protein
MKKILKYLLIILIFIGALIILIPSSVVEKLSIISPISKHSIKIKSIDTMKYSRDLAREKLKDKSFDSIVERQVKDIAQTGANYVAVGTPYDEEFLPFLKKWVDAARDNNLKVWFRGNFSGWEGWFNYPAISRQTHTQLTTQFIRDNPYLFQDGDIFTSCSECENGGAGDPRITGDVDGYRNFLISEYVSNVQAFKEINKKVNTGYFSMNYDVATLIMDPATTRALGNIVVIDHYVSSPTELALDAKILNKKSGGKIIFGEMGAPIPDLNGQMNNSKQADWINQALSGIFNSPEVIGVNYWVNTGGSTQIWDEKGNAREAVSVIKKYYISD